MGFNLINNLENRITVQTVEVTYCPWSTEQESPMWHSELQVLASLPWDVRVHKDFLPTKQSKACGVQVSTGL